MKIVTASNGKQTVKMSKTEWEQMGKTAGWLSKKAMAAIPCGTFKLMVLEKKDARPMGNNSHQLEFDFKGQSYTLADATELPSLYQALDEAFKSEIAKLQQSTPAGVVPAPAAGTPPAV